jgi:uncharacterized protein YsxB (DUF464 family)
MIDVTFERDESFIVLRLSGHAGAAKEGEDIYCASASILAYTVGQMAHILYKDKKLRKRPTVKLEKGDAEIVMKPKKDSYREVLHTYFVAQVGYALLAHNFPEYIRLKMFD